MSNPKGERSSYSYAQNLFFHLKVKHKNHHSKCSMYVSFEKINPFIIIIIITYSGISSREEYREGW